MTFKNRGAHRRTGRHNRPGSSLEQTQEFSGSEARAKGIEIAIALRVLAVDEEPPRHDQMEVVLVAAWQRRAVRRSLSAPHR